MVCTVGCADAGVLTRSEGRRSSHTRRDRTNSSSSQSVSTRYFASSVKSETPADAMDDRRYWLAVCSLVEKLRRDQYRIDFAISRKAAGEPTPSTPACPNRKSSKDQTSFGVQE